jgi:hypothetical protein
MPILIGLAGLVALVSFLKMHRSDQDAVLGVEPRKPDPLPPAP